MKDPDADSRGGAGDPGTDRQGTPDPRFEIPITIVLAIAGLASAWASFQGGIWDKQEAENYALSNAYLTESSQLLIRSGQEASVSAALFLQWLDATVNRQHLRASMVANLMPPWFADEFGRWRSTLPQDLTALKPNAPLPLFRGPSLEAAKAARAKSDAARLAAESAGRTGDTYDAANVVLATALFLAGISAVLRRPRGRLIVVSLAGMLTAGSVASLVLIALRLAD